MKKQRIVTNNVIARQISDDDDDADDSDGTRKMRNKNKKDR